MKCIFIVVGLALSVATLQASPIVNVVADGGAFHAISAETPLRSYYSSNMVQESSSSSFYAGTGDYAYLNDYWTTSHDEIIGYDENGDPIFGPVTEDQFATAEAQAYGYSRFEKSNDGHGNDLITAEVYAYENTYASASGSQAYANVSALSVSYINISFELSTLSDVLLSSSVRYGNASLALYYGGQLVADAYSLSYNPQGLYLQPGSYSLTGYAAMGGAEFSILATAAPVPEPVSLVALGLGALILRRRSR
jgi:hypothetical protein